MKMVPYTKCIALLALLPFTSKAQTIGAFTNLNSATIANLVSNDLFVLERASPYTNYNVSWGQMSNTLWGYWLTYTFITNNYAAGNAGILLSNNVQLDIAHTLSLSNLTASRLLFAGVDKTIGSAAASGAVPMDADGSATTWAQIQALVTQILTNNYASGNAGILLSNNVKVDIAHSLSLSNLTASRVVLSGADDSLGSAAASGAVSINADGSATTFAQIQALGPLIVTNGNANDVTMSNAFRIDIQHALSVSNLTASRMVLTTAADALGSAAASGAVPIDADGSATTIAQVTALGTIGTATFVTGNSVALTNSFNSTNNWTHYGLVDTNDTTHSFELLTNGSLYISNAVTGAWQQHTNDSITTSNLQGGYLRYTNLSLSISNTTAANTGSLLTATNLQITTGTAGSNQLNNAANNAPITVFTNGGGWFANDVQFGGFMRGDLLATRAYWNTNNFPFAPGAINVDFRGNYQFIVTNANFTVAGFVNITNSSAAPLVNQVWLSVSNSSASGITITMPGAPLRYFGTNTAATYPVAAGKTFKCLFQVDPHGTNLITGLMQNN